MNSSVNSEVNTFDGLTDEEKRHALGKILLARLTGADQPRPLSYGQDARWALVRSAPGAGVDNMSFAWRVRAELDIAVLRRALGSLLRRHSSLRSVFGEHEGRTVRHVREEVALPLTEHDVRGRSDAEILARLKAAAAVPFDLTTGPAIRVHVFARATGDLTILLTAHHIVADFWSLGILLPQLGRAYLACAAGLAPDETPHPIDYTTFVAAQAADVVRTADAAFAFWGREVGGGLDHVALPLSRAWPARRAFQDEALQFAIPEAIAKPLAAIAREEGCTQFMVLLAAFELVVHSYSGQKKIAVVSPTAGRSAPELHDHVGDFANHTLFIAELEKNRTLSAFLRQVQHRVASSMEHPDFPFALISRRIRVRDVPAGATPFPIKFNMPRAHTFQDMELGGGEEPSVILGLDAFAAELELIDRRVTGTCDLHLGLLPMRRGLIASLQYNLEVFDEVVIREIAARYLRALEIFSEPSALRSAIDDVSRALRR